MKKVVVVLLAIVSLILASFSIVHIVTAETAEPGSDGDPIVSQSYVDSKINEIQGKIDQINLTIGELSKDIAQYQSPVPANPVTAETGFKLIENIQGGKIILCGEGTELILRSGSAEAISGKFGLLSDLSSGNEILAGKPVPANHLIISSREDGRGIKVLKNSYILIRGSYVIK